MEKKKIYVLINVFAFSCQRVIVFAEAPEKLAECFSGSAANKSDILISPFSFSF